MREILYDKIVCLDLSDFIKGNDPARQKFVDDLGDAFTNIGFVSIKNHFLTAAMQEKMYVAVKLFFALDDVIKQRYEKSDLAGQRGYTGKGKEHAKGRNTGDLKEFYHVGQELSTDQLVAEGYPANFWPEEVPEFKDAAIDVFKALEQTGLYMLQAIALFLGLPQDYFDDKLKNGNSILRPIHYFPVMDLESVPADAVRAAAHGDINLITLLMGASAEGLQVLRRDGEWISIVAQPDQLVINVGDMLERLTNGKLRSTIHRVVNPQRHLMNTPRYSIPFFMHPRSEMSLAALGACVDARHPKQWEDITAGAFLEERLREIGLKK